MNVLPRLLALTCLLLAACTPASPPAAPTSAPAKPAAPTAAPASEPAKPTSTAPQKPAAATAASPAAALVPPSAAPAPQNLTKVKISYASPALGDLHIYVAQHQGFFRQQGIDAELVLLNTQGAVAALNNGDIEFIDSPTTLAEAANNGLPFKILYVAWKAPPWVVVGKSSINSIPELRGKNVGVGTAGSSPYQHFGAALRQVGMQLSDVNAIQTQGTQAAYSALVAGQLDAVVVTPPYDAQATQQGFHEIKFLGGMLKVPYLGLGTSTKMLQTRRGDVVKVLRALVDAGTWMRTHPDETTAILAQELKITPDLARPSVDRMLPLVSDTFEPPVDGVAEALQNQADLVGKPVGANAEEVVDVGPLREAKALPSR